jgi:hypothetical protein
VATRVAIAGDLGQLRAAGGLHRAAALDRRRVEQDEVVLAAGAAVGEDPHQPLDRLRQPGAPLVQGILARQVGEEMPELAAGGAQKAAVARDPHQHLSDAQRHHLGVRQLAAGVAPGLGQKIVGRAVDTDTEQVEVGVHRGLQVDGAVSTADFGLPLLVPRATARAVASII